HSGVLMGTPKYMPLEQLTSTEEQMGGVCDVWAFGLMLFESLTGQHPLGDVTHPSAVYSRLQDPLPRPSDLCEVPAELDELCARMLIGDCRERMPSLAEFIT